MLYLAKSVDSALVSLLYKLVFKKLHKYNLIVEVVLTTYISHSHLVMQELPIGYLALIFHCECGNGDYVSFLVSICIAIYK